MPDAERPSTPVDQTQEVRRTEPQPSDGPTAVDIARALLDVTQQIKTIREGVDRSKAQVASVMDRHVNERWKGVTAEHLKASRVTDQSIRRNLRKAILGAVALVGALAEGAYLGSTGGFTGVSLLEIAGNTGLGGLIGAFTNNCGTKAFKGHKGNKAIDAELNARTERFELQNPAADRIEIAANLALTGLGQRQELLSNALASRLGLPSDSSMVEPARQLVASYERQIETALAAASPPTPQPTPQQRGPEVLTDTSATRPINMGVV